MSDDNVTPIPGEAERNAPAAIPGYRIAEILDMADGQLGAYFHHGKALDRAGAIQDALLGAHALLDVLSSIEEIDIQQATRPGTIERTALIAQTLVLRATALWEQERIQEASDDA